MKLRNLLLTGLAMSAVSVFAQTHTQGIEYYKADQFTNARELLLRNLNNPGTDKSISYYYLGQISLLEGKTADATKYFNDGIAADEQNPYNYVGLGYIDLKKGDVKSAEKSFKLAEKYAKKDQSVNVEIARAYYNTDPVAYKDKYEKIIANALKKDSKNPDIYIFEGDRLVDEAYEVGDQKIYGSAAAKYDMATSYDPQSAVAYVKYANMYMDAKNPQYAIYKLEELIKNNPQSALGQRELANAYYKNNQFDQAAKQYGQYVKNPNHFKEDENQYAFLLFYDNDYQGGYDYASQLLSENPDNFSALRFQFMNAAQLDSMQDQLLPMAENLLAAHKSNPSNKFAAIDYNLIAEEFTKAGRTPEALELLEEAKQALPDNANFDQKIASIYINLEDYGKAADAYKDYVEKNKNAGYNEYVQLAVYDTYAGRQYQDDVKDQTGQIVRAKDLNASKKYLDLATEYANKAAAEYPEHYKPHKILGDVAFASGNSDGGITEYLTAIQLLEANPDPRYNNDAKIMYNSLGNEYMNKKNTAEAKKYYNKYLELDPDNAAYRKMVDAIK